MSEQMVQVPESWVPVFHRASLPGHPANPGRHMRERADCDGGEGCCLVEWPRSADGSAFMPMSGRFVVRTASGDEPHEDGVLLVDAAGHPYWRPE